MHAGLEKMNIQDLLVFSRFYLSFFGRCFICREDVESVSQLYLKEVVVAIGTSHAKIRSEEKLPIAILVDFDKGKELEEMGIQSIIDHAVATQVSGCIVHL